MKTIIQRVGLLMLGAVMTGCGVIYYPHDRGLHRGAYERDRGRMMQQGPGRGDHDRGRAREHQGDHRGGRKGDHGRDHRGDRDQRN